MLVLPCLPFCRAEIRRMSRRGITKAPSFVRVNAMSGHQPFGGAHYLRRLAT